MYNATENKGMHQTFNPKPKLVLLICPYRPQLKSTQTSCDWHYKYYHHQLEPQSLMGQQDLITNAS